jgi:hypothetical protein
MNCKFHLFIIDYKGQMELAIIIALWFKPDLMPFHVACFISPPHYLTTYLVCKQFVSGHDAVYFVANGFDDGFVSRML